MLLIWGGHGSVPIGCTGKRSFYHAGMAALATECLVT